MLDLKKYLEELAGPDHPFSKGVPMAELMAESNEKKNSKDGLDESTRLVLNQFLRLN